MSQKHEFIVNVAHALLRAASALLPTPGHQSHLNMAPPNHIHSLHHGFPLNIPIRLHIHRPARRTSEQPTLHNRSQNWPRVQKRPGRLLTPRHSSRTYNACIPPTACTRGSGLKTWTLNPSETGEVPDKKR